MIRNLGNPELRLRLPGLHLRRRTLQKRDDGEARIVAILVVAFPRIVIKHHRTPHIQHPPAQHGILQYVQRDMRSIDVDDIKPRPLFPQCHQRILARRFHHAQFLDMLALGNISPEAAFERGQPVVVSCRVALVLHAAGEGVDGRHAGVGMGHEIVQDPGRRGAFERPDFQNPKSLAAKWGREGLPIGADQLEPGVLEGEAAAIEIARMLLKIGLRCRRVGICGWRHVAG